MKNYLLIAQGSQAIQLLRELFSLNIKPEQISVITIGGDSNKSFNEFLDYYQMNHVTCSKSNFDGQLGFFLKGLIGFFIFSGCLGLIFCVISFYYINFFIFFSK